MMGSRVLATRDRQQTLAIRWILGAAFKQRISNGIGLYKCFSAEKLDAHRKRGIVRKKRDYLQELASFHQLKFHAYIRWW
jgi:small subunit ribosomal protein S7